MRLTWMWILVAVLIGCDGEMESDAGVSTDGGPGDAEVATDSGSVADGGDATDGGASDAALSDGGADGGAGPPPGIDEAFASCTRSGGAGATAAGTALRRVDVDLDVFPEARCADGTGAIFYVRRATEPGAAGRWVIQLQGGGSCPSADLCAQRWCSAGTSFAADKMSSRFAPEGGTRGTGILADQPANPFQGWNQVFVHYCSSDLWTGRQPAVEVEGAHPTEGTPTRYRVAFNGASIVDAVIATLRRDGGGPVMAGAEVMPDLDDAVEVTLAGASAGGAGVIYNVDRVADTLRANNTACDGSGCPLRVFGIIDSIYPVRLDRLDFSTSTICTGASLCTAEAFLRSDNAAKVALWAPELDDTCVDWHDSAGSGEGYRCTDNAYVLENHVTTPFIVRMGLTDSLIGGSASERGFTVPERGGATLDIALFAQLVSEQLLELPSLMTSANEAADVTRAPGVYGPACSKHETLSDSPNTFDVRVEVSAEQVSFPDLIQAWRADAGGTSVAVTVPGVNPSTCP